MTNHKDPEYGNKTMHEILVSRLPGIQPDIEYIGEKDCPYKMAAFLAAYTKRQIEKNNQTELNKCLHLANDLLRLGSSAYRSAIENVFLFSISRAIDQAPALKNMLPLQIKKAYRKLSYSAGI